MTVSRLLTFVSLSFTAKVFTFSITHVCGILAKMKAKQPTAVLPVRPSHPEMLSHSTPQHQTKGAFTITILPLTSSVTGWDNFLTSGNTVAGDHCSCKNIRS